MLQLIDISKTFNRGTVNEKTALSHLNLDVKDGDFITIIGSNGAGKSTMFNAICGTFFVDDGAVILDGQDITYEHDFARSKYIGHLFQDPMKGTAPHMSIEENLALAYLRASGGRGRIFSRVSKKEKELFREKLALLDMGLEDRMEHKSNQMSGGQMQRVAIARALVNNPAVILADEATGNLDTRTSYEILMLFQKLHQEGRTIIFVTHNPDISNYSSRNIRLRDGHIIEDAVNGNILSAEETYKSLPKDEDD